MKPCIKPNHLLPLAAGTGALVFALRVILEHQARESSGLLLRGHPITVAVCALLLLVAAALTLGILPLAGSNDYAKNFTASPLAAVGCLAAALGSLLTVLTAQTQDTTTLVWKVMGILAAGGMLVAGWCRWQGKQPSVLCYLSACLFLLSHLVAHYRGWCADPQVMDYLTDLLAVITMMLFCYYCAAFSADNGARRMQLGTGLLSLCYGIAALWKGQCIWLYLGYAIFAATNLCALTPAPREDAP